MRTLTFAVLSLFQGLLPVLLVAQYIEYTPSQDHCRLAGHIAFSKSRHFVSTDKDQCNIQGTS
jgi:hypothetical protein